MKNLIKFFLLLVISILTSCKTREKEVSKNETKSETFSKSEFKIERKTIDFVFNKSLFTRDFSYRSSAEETGKTEKKNIDKERSITKTEISRKNGNVIFRSNQNSAKNLNPSYKKNYQSLKRLRNIGRNQPIISIKL